LGLNLIEDVSEDRVLQVDASKTREAAPEWERLRAVAARDAVLLSARLELAGRCNLHCIHCYADSDGSDRCEPDFSTSRGVELMGELAAEGCMAVSFTGGEFALRSDWSEIAWAAKRQRMTLSLLTNGTMFSDEDIAEIARLHVLMVAVSLYGGSADVHDAVTGVDGSFDSAVSTVRRLRALDVPCRLGIVLMRGSVGEYRPVLKLANALGCQFIAEPTVRPRSDGRADVVQEYRVPAPALREFYADLDVQKGCLEGRIIRGANEPVREHAGNCTAGLTAAHIRADGDVLACVGFGETFGNIVDTSFSELWHSAIAERHRDLMRAPLRKCPECALVSYCTQRCPRLSLIEDGDLSGPSTRACDIAELAYEMRYEMRQDEPEISMPNIQIRGE
jgi:radical SAM protein with 4Fe4S-binding SPASM domain